MWFTFSLAWYLSTTDISFHCVREQNGSTIADATAVRMFAKIQAEGASKATVDKKGVFIWGASGE